MKKELNKVFYTSLLTSIIFIVIGVLLLFFPLSTIKVISYILGAIIGIAGVMGLVKFFMHKDESKYNKYGLAYGIVFIVVACFFFFKTEDIAKIMPFALGIFIIINSAIKIEYTLKLKRSNNSNWKVTLVMAIISIIFGLLLIFNPFKGALVITQVIGIIIIFYAILDIIDSYLIKCNLNEIKDAFLETPVVIYTKEEVVSDFDEEVKTKKKNAKSSSLDKDETKTVASSTAKKNQTTSKKKTTAKKTTTKKNEVKKEKPTE